MGTIKTNWGEVYTTDPWGNLTNIALKPARAHFHIGEILYDRGEFSRALDEFKIAETIAETSSPDRENFAAWIENARRALADDRPVGY